MQKLQLYIEGNRIDLFDDESISITQTIQDIKDIGKIFTDSSKTFSVPASKDNNKIFKHYYNFNILNGFDGRRKVNADIELNFIPFSKGSIKLEGVSLKNNKPNAYKITFFGRTVSLKDLVGEDKLNALSGLNSLNETYSPTDVENGLKRNPATNDVVVPLVTHTKRLFYDSASFSNNNGNLYYHTGVGTSLHGVAWSELKYALRVHTIVEAIEQKYGITFSDDFLSSTNAVYYDLFMWLHRKKGDVGSGSQVQEYTKLVDGWTAEDGFNSSMINSSTFKLINAEPLSILFFNLELYRATSEPYDVSVLRNGVEVYSESNITATNHVIDMTNYAQEFAEYEVILSYESSMSFTNIAWKYDYNVLNGNVENDLFETGLFSLIQVFEFIITEQIPEIKVIDFLTGLFKMFNLTAYVEKNSDTIVVLPLDDFYASGTSYDITKYVDTKKSSVNVALPYREVSFSYDDTETFLAETHNQLFNQEWGKTDYSQVDENGNLLNGSLYKINIPFAHFKFERLYDNNDFSRTTIQWGWSVDDNRDSFIGKPFLFYPVLNAIEDDGVAEGISFVDALDSDGSYTSHKQITGSIVMPSNAVSFSSDTTTANINFKAERNEYWGNTYTNTLFSQYYSDYIASVFDFKNRITKLTAYLPLNILYNYNLADRFIVNGINYKINKITSNLKNGQSTLELLNDL